MSKLIELDAASDMVRLECGKWVGLANTIIKEFYALKPVDAVPVRHGRWIRGGHKDRNYVCSCCGYERYACFEKPSAEFCEDCGAKMDGKDGGND